MNWMTRWPGAFPVFVATAQGAEVTDVDGNDYADLCLGDTGAMTVHSPPATVAAIQERARTGITAMLPTEDAVQVGEEMKRRFGLSNWQFTLSATDANRSSPVRAARSPGARRSSSTTTATTGASTRRSRPRRRRGPPREGNVGPPVDRRTTRIVEINDLEALERELSHGDVACVLVEPALTNIGIVLADDGYHERLRALTRETGTLLVIDETHTLCCGPGGYTRSRASSPTS